MTEGRTHITLASPPCGVLPPPNPRRTHGRTGRATVTAGTLTPEGYAVDGVAADPAAFDTNGEPYYLHMVPLTDHSPREWYDEAESVRQARLRRWQAIR